MIDFFVKLGLGGIGFGVFIILVMLGVMLLLFLIAAPVGIVDWWKDLDKDKKRKLENTIAIIIIISVVLIIHNQAQQNKAQEAQSKFVDNCISQGQFQSGSKLYPTTYSNCLKLYNESKSRGIVD